MEFVTFENITAPNGKLPVNTSGGNIAECYMHGLELVNEAVRQVRGDSTCQVPNCENRAGGLRPDGLTGQRPDRPSACRDGARRSDGLPKRNSTCPKDYPAPRAQRDGLGQGILGRDEAPRTRGAALQRLRNVPMGPRMDLPQDAIRSISDGKRSPAAVACIAGSEPGIRSIRRCGRRVPISSRWWNSPTPAISGWSAICSVTRIRIRRLTPTSKRSSKTILTRRWCNGGS